MSIIVLILIFLIYEILGFCIICQHNSIVKFSEFSTETEPTSVHCLTMGLHSEKHLIWWFCRCANIVEHSYTYLGLGWAIKRQGKSWTWWCTGSRGRRIETLKPAWVTEQVQDLPGLYSGTLSQQNQTTNKL
jgi:hypothetical protein